MTTLPPTVSARGIVRTYSPDVLPDPDASPVPIEARSPGRQAVALPAPTGADVDVPAPPRIATKEAPPLPALRKTGNIFGGSPFTGDIDPAPITPGLIAARFRSELSAVVDLAELRTAEAAVTKERAIQTEHSSPVRARKILRLSEIYATNPTEVNRLALQAAKTISESDAVLVSQLAQSRIAETLRSVWPALNRLAGRAAELLEGEAKTIWNSQFEFESPWGISPVPSALVQGLRVAAETQKNLTKALRPPSDGLPELAVCLLAVTKDLPASPVKPQ